MKKDLKLEDYDGTIKGRAALISMDLENPGHPMYEDFVEEDDTRDPIDRCWRLWESIHEDFPGHEPAVIANPRAEYLRYVREMNMLGIGVLTPLEYLGNR